MAHVTSGDVRPQPYLDNKLGIVSRERMLEIEYSHCVATIFSTTQYLAKALDGWGANGGPKKLRVAHRRILGELYPWAGDLREVDTLKATGFKTTKFVPFDKIDKRLSQVFGKFYELHAERGQLALGLAKLQPDELAASLATLFIDLNAIHAFREGNGRSMQTICSALALQAGYDMKWEMVSGGKATFVSACIQDHIRLESKDIEEPRLFYVYHANKDYRFNSTYVLARIFRQVMVPLDQPALEPKLPERSQILYPPSAALT
jgi:cell filamentation protein